MSFDDAFTESVRDNASARFAHAKSPTGPGAPDSRQMDVILFFARRPGARGAVFVFADYEVVARVGARDMRNPRRDAFRRKTRHITVLSHEIRNPVNGSASVEAIRRAHTVMRVGRGSKVIPNGSGRAMARRRWTEMHDSRGRRGVYGPASRTAGRRLGTHKLRRGSMTPRSRSSDGPTRARARRMQISRRWRSKRFASRVGGFGCRPAASALVATSATRSTRAGRNFAGTPPSSL